MTFYPLYKQERESHLAILPIKDFSTCTEIQTSHRSVPVYTTWLLSDIVGSISPPYYNFHLFNYCLLCHNKMHFQLSILLLNVI